MAMSGWGKGTHSWLFQIGERGCKSEEIDRVLPVASVVRALTHTPSFLECAQVASDLGRNDQVFFARTHLGNLLKPGELQAGHRAGSLDNK
jgi:hypothetical protein